MRFLLPLVVAVAAAAPAAAEVRSASPEGFEVESRAVVAATPAQAYAMLGRPALWWSSKHSWSGDSSNMSLELRPGGCFCERLPEGGGVAHGRVVFAKPGSLLRLNAALGPLQSMAVVGTLTWTLKAVPGGTEIVQTYSVGGYVEGGADKIAPAVDQVLAEQLDNLKRRLAR